MFDIQDALVEEFGDDPELSLTQMRDELSKKLKSVLGSAKGSNRDLTTRELETVERKTAMVEELDTMIEKQKERAAVSKGVFEQIIAGQPSDDEPTSTRQYLSLSGAKAQQYASKTARAMREHAAGRKAFIAEGTHVAGVPVTDKNPAELGRPAASIVELLPTVKQETGSYAFLRQTVFTNNAGVVASGATKPTSPIGIESVPQELRVIAHLTEPVDKFLLQDNETLQQFITRQMYWGVLQKLEQQIIAGTGAGGQILGLSEATGIQEQAAGVDDVTTLRAAITKLETSGYNGSAFIVNANDWEAIETARATSGSFDLGGPIDRAERKVWGTPVVPSANVPEGEAYALDTSTLLVRFGAPGIEVAWDASGTLFEKNQVRARIEGRFQLDIMQPAGIVHVTLPTEGV